jgi:hypothetical protein
MLEFMERAWLQSKDPFAIIEGIEICQTWRQPLAEWLHNATLAAISKQIPPVEVRHHRERVMHYTRWWLVRELQKQDPAMTRDEAYAAASQQLKKTAAMGGEDAIKFSFKKVRRAVDEGRAEQFLITVDV